MIEKRHDLGGRLIGYTVDELKMAEKLNEIINVVNGSPQFGAVIPEQGDPPAPPNLLLRPPSK